LTGETLAELDQRWVGKDAVRELISPAVTKRLAARSAREA
jgi:hypothetical protein